MKFFKYMKSLIETDTGNSSKSFALVMSTIISFITGLVICFVISYDVVVNGYVKTDLESMGIFMLCIGSYIAASGVPKIFGDGQFYKWKGHNNTDGETPADDEVDRSFKRRRKKQNNAIEDEEIYTACRCNARGFDNHGAATQDVA